MDIPIVGDVLASLLEPVKRADQALAEALQLAAKGVDWTGQELGEVGSALHNIQLKLEQLQKMLKGGDEEN